MKYLIVGLGNIGTEYIDTRHNIGFAMADALAENGKVPFESGRYGDMAKLKFRSRILLTLKPSTYMNLSGKAIKYWLTKEKIPIENLLVIVDDLALPIGTLRLRGKGGDGGHNGLISIITELGTQNFARIRVGIGDDFSKGHQVNYVLGKWTSTEIETLKPKVNTTIEIIKSFVSIGITRTMNVYNTKQDTGKEQD